MNSPTLPKRLKVRHHGPSHIAIEATALDTYRTDLMIPNRNEDRESLAAALVAHYNAHEALVAALEELNAAHGSYQSARDCGGPSAYREAMERLCDAQATARDILATLNPAP